MVNDLISNKGTKEKIRDVAIDLFSEKGYHATSIREIARLVNISDSTIYSHYNSKEEIMEYIIEDLINQFNSGTKNTTLEELIDQYDPEDLILKSIRELVQQLKNNHIGKILRLMCIELYRNDKLNDFFQNQYVKPTLEYWSELFRRIMLKGYIKEYNVNILAQEFLNYNLYLLFDTFLINYSEKKYPSLVEKLLNDQTTHIKFLFDMIKVEKIEKS